MLGGERILTDKNLPTDIRVLHVDDDELVLRASKASLEGEADIKEVIPVRTNETAIEYLFERDTSIDCVVSDYDPEGSSGLQLLRVIRERRPNLPFILFTDEGNEDVASRAISSGATNYLQKGRDDIGFLSLSVQIQQAVSHRRTEMEIHRGFRAIEMTREGIALLTDTLDFNYVNKAYAELFGYDQQALIGRDWATTMTDESVECLREEVVPRVDSDGSWIGEITGRRKTGEEVALTLSVSTVGENEYVCAVRDVTERKERERALVRENERLDEFASRVSHDLRGPLSIIFGYLDVARETGKDEHFDEIEEAADRIDAIISDLLEVAREGKKELDHERVALRPLAETMWDGIDCGDATLRFDAIDGQILADANRLTELFANLFRNAVEHGGDDVTISVGTTADGFYVEDDGSGIPQSDHRAVVESGYSTAESTGLGLSIVQEIADSHDWSMRIEESDGGGARFHFSDVKFADARRE